MRSSVKHDSIKHMLKHFLYSGGWKKFEPLWNFIIKTRNLNNMLPILESILSKVGHHKTEIPQENPTHDFENANLVTQSLYQ